MIFASYLNSRPNKKATFNGRKISKTPYSHDLHAVEKLSTKGHYAPVFLRFMATRLKETLKKQKRKGTRLFKKAGYLNQYNIP